MNESKDRINAVDIPDVKLYEFPFNVEGFAKIDQTSFGTELACYLFDS